MEKEGYVDVAACAAEQLAFRATCFSLGEKDLTFDF